MKWSIEDFVFGATDGAVTTFAVVSGVVGASLSPAIILILGFANLFADGFSMAISNYLSAKSRLEYIEREREREKWEIENLAEQEIQKIRDIYSNKGFKNELLEEVVNTIVSKRKVWLDTLMKEKLGLMEDKNENPLSKAITTFAAFNLVGLVPLTPFIFAYFSDFASLMAIEHIFIYSIVFTAISFFLIGLIKGKVVDKSPIKSGLNTLMIGAIAASVAFLVGSLLSDYVKH